LNAAYTAEHFPAKMRAAEHGFTYNAGNALGGSVTPILRSLDRPGLALAGNEGHGFFTLTG